MELLGLLLVAVLAFALFFRKKPGGPKGLLQVLKDQRAEREWQSGVLAKASKIGDKQERLRLCLAELHKHRKLTEYVDQLLAAEKAKGGYYYGRRAVSEAQARAVTWFDQQAAELAFGSNWQAELSSIVVQKRTADAATKEKQNAAEAAERQQLLNELRQRTQDTADRILSGGDAIVQRFLEIAERRVSRQDEYGDESWGQLPKLIYECIQKLAQAQGFAVCLRSPRNYESIEVSGFSGSLTEGTVDKSRVCLLLVEDLRRRFEEFHVELQAPDAGYSIERMDGLQFERHVFRLFNEANCEVQLTPTVGDQGADLLVKHRDKRIVVQIKKWSAAVGNGAVQEVVAARSHYSCSAAWVVTNSRFTRSARELAATNGVVLVEGNELTQIASILDRVSE